jgi:DNA-directed RNA polymerase subunit RPC12/RpoP
LPNPKDLLFFARNKDSKMNLLNFIATYPDEDSCRAKFKEYRDQQGVICPKCGHKEQYWKQDKSNYECKHCHYRQSLRANTVMHGSNLPFRYWFIAIHLLTSTKKSFSAAELQRQLGHKRYEPIWYLLHKLRGIMGKWDEQYSLLEELVDNVFKHIRQTVEKHIAQCF